MEGYNFCFEDEKELVQEDSLPEYKPHYVSSDWFADSHKNQQICNVETILNFKFLLDRLYTLGKQEKIFQIFQTAKQDENHFTHTIFFNFSSLMKRKDIPCMILIEILETVIRTLAPLENCHQDCLLLIEHVEREMLLFTIECSHLLSLMKDFQEVQEFE